MVIKNTNNILTQNAQEALNNIKHQNFHTEEILKIYSDLEIASDGNNTDYYSASVNEEVDQFSFEKENIATYINVYLIVPFKFLNINCSQCPGEIQINCNPHKIPLYIEREISYGSDYVWYSCMYEELFKIHNFNTNVLAASQLEIISKLEAAKKANKKLNTLYMSDNIKKLLTFT